MTIVDFYDGIKAMKNGVSYKGTPFKQNIRHDRPGPAIQNSGPDPAHQYPGDRAGTARLSTWLNSRKKRNLTEIL